MWYEGRVGIVWYTLRVCVLLPLLAARLCVANQLNELNECYAYNEYDAPNAYYEYYELNQFNEYLTAFHVQSLGWMS